MTDMLTDKVVLVTGAASGIGLAAAKTLAREGAAVVVVDMNADGAAKAAANLRDLGYAAMEVTADVSREDEVEQMVKLAVDRFGRIDGAFNNAGIGPSFAPAGEIDLANWLHVLDVNLTGVMLCMKHEIRAMAQTGGGAIVNMSSVAGLQGVPMQAAYSASKHGIIGLTKTASTEYAGVPIRVNAICAGAVATPALAAMDVDFSKIVQTPMGRVCQPNEVGEVAAWLLSQGASFVTGQSIVVDGGRIATSFVPPA